MKKLWILMLAICLCLSTFTSCQNGTSPEAEVPKEPQNAETLWANITEAMKASNAYETDITSKVSLKEVYGAGSIVSSDITMKSAVKGIREGEYYDYSDIRVKSITMRKDPSTGAPRVESKDGTNILAFFDGTLYVTPKEADGQKYQGYFCSPLNKEEYLIFRANQKKDLFSLALNSGSNVSFAKNEDGTWTLQASGYTKETVDQAVASLAVLDRAAFDYELTIKDMEVSVRADSQFRLTEVKVKFIFAEANNQNSFEMTALYSNYDATIPNTLDTTRFREIADYRLLNEFETMLEDFNNRQSGSFLFDVEELTRFNNYGDTLTQYYKETDTVIYGEENGGFFYEINSDLSFGNIKISYKNGEQTVSAFGIDQTMAHTEENAKADINDFMMNIKYNPKHIFNLQKYAEGVYELDFHTTNYVDLADYDYLFAAYDGYADYISSLNMKITVKDGSIVKIENSIGALGKYGDNRSVNVDIVYSITIMQ